jgi:hypothetical protein
MEEPDLDHRPGQLLRDVHVVDELSTRRAVASELFHASLDLELGLRPGSLPIRGGILKAEWVRPNG